MLRPVLLALLTASSVALLSGCPAMVVSGTVEDQNGNILEDAVVIDRYNENHTSEVNSNGEFAIQSTRKNVKGQSQGLLEIRAEGYAPQIVPVPHQTNVSKYKVPVKLVTVDTKDIDTDGDTVLHGTAEGNAFTVRVSGVSEEGLKLVVGGAGAGQGPGTMRDAAAEPDFGLQTGGMFYISIVDEDGDPWDGDADVAIEMDPYQMPPVDDAGDVNSYSLDDDGMWTNDGGMGDPDDPDAIDDPNWPGWTNCDRSVPFACVKGTVLVAEGGACQGGRVQLSNLGMASYASTDAKGNFCINSAYYSNGDLKIYGVTLGNVVFDQEPGNCTREEYCKDVGTFDLTDSEACGEEGAAPAEEPSNVDPSCATIIATARDSWEDIYSGVPCVDSCLDIYIDCLEDTNCVDYESCLSAATDCATTCA